MALKVATKRAPSDAELRDLKFAFASPNTSSRIPLSTKDLATVGIGAEPDERLIPVGTNGAGRGERIEPRRAADQVSVVASDAFFLSPTACSLHRGRRTAVIQPAARCRLMR